VGQAQERCLAALTTTGVDPSVAANAHGPSAGLPYVDLRCRLFYAARGFRRRRSL
jgi:hypothetical protein